MVIRCSRIRNDPVDPVTGKRRLRRGVLEITSVPHVEKFAKTVDLTEFWRKANRPRVDAMSLHELQVLFTEANTAMANRSVPAIRCCWITWKVCARMATGRKAQRGIYGIQSGSVHPFACSN